MTHIHHTLDYIEIPAADLATAKAFYTSAFGWAFNDYGPQYAGIRTADGAGEVGGLNASSEPSRGGPLVLLYSEDLDATVEAVRDAGGQVIQEPREFPGGRRFHFTDPSGVELGVWSSS